MRFTSISKIFIVVTLLLLFVTPTEARRQTFPLLVYDTQSELPSVMKTGSIAYTINTKKLWKFTTTWEEIGAGGAAAWGDISGTLSAQTDLQGALDGKSSINHDHDDDYAPLSHASAINNPHSVTASQVGLGNVTNDAQIAKSIGTAKGQIIGFSASATPGALPAGNTGDILYADSTQSLGIKWAAPSGASSQGVLKDMQITILQSDGTLNAASGVQTWCGTNKTAQDVFTVAANSTYLVEGEWYVNTGATTHTTAMAWALGGGATVADVQYQVMLWSAAANAVTTTQSTVHVSGVASKVLNATSTAVYTIIQFKGIFVTTNAGTITPQINFSANPTGTNLMKRGSWISFSKIGADTFTEAGGWE